MLVAIKTIIIEIIIIVFDSKLTSFIFSKWGLDYLLIKIIIVGTVIIVRQIVSKLTIFIFSKWGGDTCSDYLSSPMFRSLHRPRYWPKQVKTMVVMVTLSNQVYGILSSSFFSFAVLFDYFSKKELEWIFNHIAFV